MRMLGQPYGQRFGRFAARPCNDDASPTERPYAYAHVSGAALPCPKGRKRYVELSENPFTLAISDGALCFSVPFTPQKTATLHVD